MLYFIKNQKIKKASERQNELLKEIEEICEKIAITNNWFQIENDSDLIEACVHQRASLNAKYKYLIKQIRKNEFTK